MSCCNGCHTVMHYLVIPFLIRVPYYEELGNYSNKSLGPWGRGRLIRNVTIGQPTNQSAPHSFTIAKSVVRPRCEGAISNVWNIVGVMNR